MAFGTASAHAQRRSCIDHEWRFRLGDNAAILTNPKLPNTWIKVNLPHDWSVEKNAAATAGGTVIGPFSTNSVGGYQTGFTVGGEGWYSKHLAVTDAQLVTHRFQLYFEGAYNQTEVYVNGTKVIFNPYGYSSFRVDITDYLRQGVLAADGTCDSHIAVRVLNEGNNSRWYAGSGIYRHVWLVITPQVHLDEWDLVLPTALPLSSTSSALSAVLYNESDEVRTGRLQVTISDAYGTTVATATSETLRLEPSASQSVSLDLTFPSVHRWSPEDPYLYRAEVCLEDQTTGTVDTVVKHFGIRSLSFSAARGFVLNGVPTLLQGGCVHHDNGLLGAAAYDRAEDRKLALLKAQGYNAVRTSHGIPSEHFLDACDSLGLLVIDEAFDQWLLEKNREDYHRFFAEWSDHDLETMVRRDRNHPSVIMWSIGNEIPGRIEPEGFATAKRLRQTVLKWDTTRPITAAICSWDAGDEWNSAGHGWDIQDAKAFASLDVGGYNYLYDKYEHDHGTHPDRIICGLESYPKHASQNWDLVEKHPYVIGDFVWTAMDYLGEAGIGSASYRASGNQPMFQGWPWYNGWCGDIDLIGQKKPQSYYRDVVWHRAPVTMAVERPAPAGTHQSISAWGWQLEQQSWTYPDLNEHSGNMTINVYSRAPKVRLYLNGVSQGDHQPGNTYWTGYYIPYQPGTLRVVNLNTKGEEIEGEDFVLRTTGDPVALRLTADRTEFAADGSDLVYVTIELVDAEGQVVTSNSTTRVSVTAAGSASLLAAGNASPNDMESFRSPSPKLYNGRALAIVKSNGRVGKATISVRSSGLKTASVSLTSITSNPDGISSQSNGNKENMHAASSTVYNLAGQRLADDPDHLVRMGRPHLYVTSGRTMIIQ